MERNLKKLRLRPKRILGIACGLFLSAGVFLGGANEPEKKFDGFNLLGYDGSGRQAWVVNGDTADIIGSEMQIHNMDAKTFDEESVRITADIGIVDQVSGKMHLEKNVVITSDRGAQLFTDTLDWDREQDLVTTDDDVIMTDPRMVAAGSGVRAHPNLRKGTLLKKVTIRVDTKPENDLAEILTLTCDGPMNMDQDRATATFEDNVVAMQKDRTVKSDRMEVYFDNVTNQIREVVCIGHVVIVQGENISYARKAVYKGKEGQLVLLGRPQLNVQTEGDNGDSPFGN